MNDFKDKLTKAFAEMGRDPKDADPETIIMAMLLAKGIISKDEIRDLFDLL